ncbi:MAG: hypothetical protein ACRDZX_02650, partial [Acidimicrobiales bacterium]
MILPFTSRKGLAVATAGQRALPVIVPDRPDNPPCPLTTGGPGPSNCHPVRSSWLEAELGSRAPLRLPRPRSRGV